MRRALVLAFVLLFAQQVALAHAIGHLDATPSQAETRLCDLHSTMGSVLGGVHAAPPPVAFADVSSCKCISAQAADASLAPPQPASRGPPSVSLK